MINTPKPTKQEIIEKVITRAETKPYEDKVSVWGLVVTPATQFDPKRPEGKTTTFYIKTENAKEAKELNTKWAIFLVGESENYLKFKNVNIKRGNYSSSSLFETSLDELPY